MKHQKAFAYVGAAALTGIAVYVLYHYANQNLSDVSGVTSTKKEGPTGSITTTPLKLGKLAFVSAASTLKTLVSAPARLLQTVRSTQIAAATDKLQPFGNPASFAAALNTNRNQTAANYNPSGRAILN